MDKTGLNSQIQIPKNKFFKQTNPSHLCPLFHYFFIFNIDLLTY